MINLKQCLSDIYKIDFKNLNFLECGAHDIHNLITIDFIKNNNCWYLEPNPEDYVKLLNNKLSQCLDYALSNIDGEVEFSITSHGGNSSIEHCQIHREELETYNSSFSKTKVKCITYSTLLEKVNCIFDVFCLDIEGHELSVLNSIKKLSSDKLPKIIVIECGYDWDKRLKVLESMGYCIDIYWINNCILSNIDNTKKNSDKIQYYNNLYREFVWFGKVIYKNPFSLV